MASCAWDILSIRESLAACCLYFGICKPVLAFAFANNVDSRRPLTPMLEHTNYDELLMRGTERLDARALVREKVGRKE